MNEQAIIKTGGIGVDDYVPAADKRHIYEKDVRCPECERLLTKMKIMVSLPADVPYGDGSTVSRIFKNLEISFGLETKCNRCKHISHELKAV